MSALAHAGYNQTRKLTATPRQIEAQIFSRIAADIEAASVNKKETYRELAEAIHQNTKLWSLLITDLASEENAYPDELKANLINLGTFSIRQGRSVLAGSAEAQPLVEINRSVAAGLRGAPAEEAA